MAATGLHVNKLPSTVYPLVAFWIASVGVGVAWLLDYSLQSVPTSPANDWPTAAQIAPGDRKTLLIFLHPHCACSRASARQLTEICSQAESDAQVVAAFYCPRDEAQSWVHSDLWSTTSLVPGIRVFIDRDGREASTFGVRASGHVLLFNENGGLEFSGGITSARGHDGTNVGSQAVLRRLNGLTADLNKTPVFGCEIVAE